jgi:hypothetical protein
LAAFGLTLLVLAVIRLRRYRLKERYALLLVLLGIPFMLLAVWPGAVGWLSQTLSIDHGTILLMGISAFLFLTIFELLSIVSQQDAKITTLAQMVGILEQKQKERRESEKSQ